MQYSTVKPKTTRTNSPFKVLKRVPQLLGCCACKHRRRIITEYADYLMKSQKKIFKKGGKQDEPSWGKQGNTHDHCLEGLYLDEKKDSIWELGPNPIFQRGILILSLMTNFEILRTMNSWWPTIKKGPIVTNFFSLKMSQDVRKF